MAVVIYGPLRARQAAPLAGPGVGAGDQGAVVHQAPSQAYAWEVELRRGPGGRFYIVARALYDARVEKVIVPAIILHMLAVRLANGAPLARVVDAPLPGWGALPRWLRRQLAKTLLPLIYMYSGGGG